MPVMEKVVSNIIAKVGYEEDKDTLYIEFLNGSIYKYYPVTVEEHEALMNSGSVGSYFARNIKKTKQYEKVN